MLKIILIALIVLFSWATGVAIYQLGEEKGRQQALEMSAEVIENIVDKFKELQECTAVENEE